MIDIDYFQIIKWIVIVLLAGFIGQFGKSLATYLMKKARGTKSPDLSQTATGVAKEPKEAPTPSPFTEGKALGNKAEKKTSKALIKMRKKETR